MSLGLLVANMSDETTEKIGITSTLSTGGVVVFDIPYTEADDHDETHLAFEILSAAVGK